MQPIVEWLSGKKTYILVALAALTIMVQFLSAGDFSADAIRAFLNALFSDGAIATLRAGIAKK